MEPLKPADRRAILQQGPGAEAECREYEQLLAERFASDPSLPKAPDARQADARREQRLAELHKKLLGAVRVGA